MTTNKWVVIASIGFSLIGCGQAPTGTGSEASLSASAASTDCTRSILLGSWLHPASLDVVRFKSDCSFESVGCGSAGTYSPEDISLITDTGATATSTVSITKAPKYTSCIQSGAHACKFKQELSDYSITFSCDGGPTYKYYWVAE